MKGFIDRKYRNLRHGDVNKNWRYVMIHALILDPEEPEHSWQKRVGKTILTVFMLISSLRYISAGLLRGEGHDYMFGHTFLCIGSIGRMTCIAAGLAFTQGTALRILNLQSGFGPQWFLLRLKSMTLYPEQDLRVKKKYMASQVLFLALVAFLVQTIGCYTIGMTTLVINWYTSRSQTETAMWVIWWMQGMALVTLYELDMALFPAIWFVMVVNFRMDLTYLIECVTVRTGNRKLLRRTWAEMYKLFTELSTQIVNLNRFSAGFLTTIVVFNSRYVCLTAHVTRYTSGYFTLAFLLVGTHPFILACVVQTLASRINSLADKLHRALCSLQARSWADLKLRQRVQLLQMLDELNPEQRQLTMTTSEGAKYTSASFAGFVVETISQYLLIVTLEKYIELE